MRRGTLCGACTALWALPAVLAACAGSPDRNTLAGLRSVEADVAEVPVERGLDRAMQGYQSFLEEAPESSLTPEAMRRLADLKLEKEYGILGGPPPASIAEAGESDEDFERRATGGDVAGSGAGGELRLPDGRPADPAGPLEAIELYDRILATYPGYPHNDQVLYQKARAFDELGRPDEAIAVIETLVVEYPGSRFLDEVQYRRGEYFFTRRRYLDAEEAYASVTSRGSGSEYYELALYKLGWALYKQQLHEEALHQYFALLDYKVSTGYDFDQTQDEDAERRVADTYRVISLCFSNLGGPEVVESYFAANGRRSYEDRIYRQHGEFYLEKLRYQDAAAVFQAFIALNPLHRASPHFGMRVVEIYEAGGFPKLVLEAKKDFAATYGLDSEYWRHFEIAEAPEVRTYLKTNLADLANHYHALYQNGEAEGERPAQFQEALRWYRGYLASFPQEPESPALNQRLADLLLEHEDFGEAAREYERTAYAYAGYERAAESGYAAIYAHRERQERAKGKKKRAAARRDAVASTLRFVDAFPAHEQAAAVLGAAVDDLHGMGEFQQAIAQGRRLIDGYPQATPEIRRSAWTAIARSSFEIGDYPGAEGGWARVLEATPAEGESRQAVVDQLAAAIYKQGEQANLAGDPRAAADHFLRVRQAAPGSEIRPAAEYDAAAALMRLEDWAGAAGVLDAFRQAYPEHELAREATRQLAFVYREDGSLAQAAAEYERVAAEADDPDLRREARLEAGDLYEQAHSADRALAAYLAYVDEFPEPIEPAVETRSKIAGMYLARHDDGAYTEQLRQIVEIDAGAGGQRSARVRYLAAQSALVLAQELCRQVGEVALVLPFEQSLAQKQERMGAALEALDALVDYEVADVTAGATFLMAEVYAEFSRALIASERPADLSPAELSEYAATLEGEAFPFEEKAIAVHEKNLELLGTGVYNAWIEKSLARLAELSPGRYARFEASSGPIPSLETYTYRVPVEPGAAEPAQVVVER